MKKCNNCGNLIEDHRLIACPFCKTNLSESELEPFVLSQVQENHIVRIVWRRVKKWLIGGFSVLTIISLISLVFGLYKAYIEGIKLFENILVANVSREFKTDKIKKTVEKVAKSQANEILKNQVNPEVAQFKSQTSEKITQFEDFLVAIKKRYEGDYQLLSTEVAKLKHRNQIVQLGDSGISEASRDSFDELNRISKQEESPDIKAAAKAEIFRIKNFWAFMSSVSGELTKEGKIIKVTEVTTNDLIGALLNNKNSKVRIIVAREMRNRKEKGVSEALLECVKTDRNLEVVKEAVQSFGIVTGFISPDVFAFEPLQNWWKEHSEEVNAKLKDRK